MEPLHSLIADDRATLKPISQYLDGLVPESRWDALKDLSRAQMRELWRLAESTAPVTLEDFVPAEFPPLMPVRHRGLNSLPVPRPFRLFEKRFCRPTDGTRRLFGYNHGITMGILGPGFYVAHSTTGNPAWEARGAQVVDYFMVPDGPVSQGWPKVVPNSRGLQILVYNGTRDFMRKVSAHVTVGAAYKGEWALDQYFILCREG